MRARICLNWCAGRRTEVWRRANIARPVSPPRPTRISDLVVQRRLGDAQRFGAARRLPFVRRRASAMRRVRRLQRFRRAGVTGTRRRRRRAALRSMPSTQRSATLRSSRTLPGQRVADELAQWAGSHSGTGRSWRAAACNRKCWKKQQDVSRRSRRRQATVATLRR